MLTNLFISVMIFLVNHPSLRDWPPNFQRYIPRISAHILQSKVCDAVFKTVICYYTDYFVPT